MRWLAAAFLEGKRFQVVRTDARTSVAAAAAAAATTNANPTPSPQAATGALVANITDPHATVGVDDTVAVAVAPAAATAIAAAAVVSITIQALPYQRHVATAQPVAKSSPSPPLSLSQLHRHILNSPSVHPHPCHTDYPLP